ncbi:MAG: glycosyltransferase family 2 protein [Terriglobia bacterium]
MRWIFWISLGFIAYTYFGYPLALYLRSRWRPRLVRLASITPSVSIIVALRNEAASLPQKLQNLFALEYPAGSLEVVAVSDGSTDETNRILQDCADLRLKALVLDRHQGKAAALNRGMQLAEGEIAVFTDARQLVEPQALRFLVANFADPAVGCVSGELMLGEIGGLQSGQGIGLYWRLEKIIRSWESQSGSVVGVTGALYAARKAHLAPLPEGTLLDDVYQPMQIARQGARVIFEPRARAWDSLASSHQEFRRKVRTLTGNYQLLQLAPWLLSRENPLWFKFISHKLCRLVVPFALLALLGSSLALPTPFYRLAAAAQILFYGLAALQLGKPRGGVLKRISEAAHAFLLLNAAAAVAFFYFVTGKRQVWVR